MSAVLAETDKAWLAGKPDGAEAWLAKSVVKITAKIRKGGRYLSSPNGCAERVGCRNMTGADLAQLKTRLKAQARYRWRRMEAAIAAHDREAYPWHPGWRAAITKELRDLSDPILVALRNHPLRCARPSQRARLRARMDRRDRHARQTATATKANTVQRPNNLLMMRWSRS